MGKIKQPKEQVEVSEAPSLSAGAVVIWSGERNGYSIYFFLDPRISRTIFYHIQDINIELGSFVEFEGNSYYTMSDEEKIDVVLQAADQRYLDIMYKGKLEYVSRGLYLH